MSPTRASPSTWWPDLAVRRISRHPACGLRSCLPGPTKIRGRKLRPTYLDRDVLVPKPGVLRNELSHHRDTFVVLDDHEFHTLGLQPVFSSLESLVFANDNFGNLIEEGCPAAHRARRQGCVQDAVPIDRRRLAAGLLKRAHLPVQKGIPLLHAHIVATADDLAMVDDH